MKQHLHIITLGVRDFERSKKFYTEVLGWKQSSASNEGISFFQTGGVVLAIYPRDLRRRMRSFRRKVQAFKASRSLITRVPNLKWMKSSRI
jgi:catechol-2,3-dioxygenase